MKRADVYEAVCVLSLFCLSGDSDSMTMFLIWHAVWLIIFFYSCYKLQESRDDG